MIPTPLRTILTLSHHPLVSALALSVALSAASTVGTLLGQELYLRATARRRRQIMEAQLDRSAR